MPERPDTPRGAYQQRAPRRRRRASVWTLLAPAGAIVLFVAIIVALSNSCLKDGCHSKSSDSNSDKPANDLPVTARVKVKSGDSMGSIASKYHLDLADLKACNPNVDPQEIQPGQFIRVSAKLCEGKDLAGVGANPDPLAGETSASNGAAPVNSGTKQTDGSTNGTAAVDPSAGGTGSPAPPATSTNAAKSTPAQGASADEAGN